MQPTVMTTATRIAKSLEISEDDVFQQALASFLYQQKRHILQHQLELLTRYGVNSLDNLEAKIAKGEVVEHPAWEDLIVAENLSVRLEELDAYLEDLQDVTSYSSE